MRCRLKSTRSSRASAKTNRALALVGVLVELRGRQGLELVEVDPAALVIPGKVVGDAGSEREEQLFR